ncbi:MAG: PaREP1 family protein [Nitrososphaerales archaeon]
MACIFKGEELSSDRGLMMGLEEVKLVRDLLDEGKAYLNKGDSMQASEKFYKAVEESIKLLAEKHRLPEYEEAIREVRWWARLLARAARTLASKLDEDRIEFAWSIAFDLHVWGFHERGLRVEDVKRDIPHIEWLIEYTEKALS